MSEQGRLFVNRGGAQTSMTKKEQRTLVVLGDLLNKAAWDVVWTDRECFHARWTLAQAVTLCAVLGDTARFGWYLRIFQRRTA